MTRQSLSVFAAGTFAVGTFAVVLGWSLTGQAQDAKVDYQKPLPAAPQGEATFQPPLEAQLDDSDYAAMVRKGRDLFMNTQQLRGTHVSNDQNCVNCHLDAGRLAGSAPMWAAFGMYPAYRGKNHKVNTLADRIQGCFTYSMNGVPPKQGDEVLVALQTYFHWLATGAPINQAMPGRGYPKLEKPEQGYDIQRGAQVYVDNCAICHGDNSAGQKVGEHQVFPPLWGDGAYNWGAGMHRVNTAAGFIKANMPLGKPDSLTDQQAWDVAAFINSHERPQDPRREGMESLGTTQAKFHQHEGYYGKKVGDHTLGDRDNYR